MIAAVRCADTYSVVLAGAEEFLASRHAWNDLAERVRYPSIFCGWEWTATWWEHYGAGRQLRLLMIYCNGQLKGILPLFLQRQLAGRDARVGRVRYCTAADLYRTSTSLRRSGCRCLHRAVPLAGMRPRLGRIIFDF
jgi:CelD/BcsL family acetyltransferase involved in cellulose biosynthesis